MAIDFDRTLQVHVQAVQLRARRAELIAGNLANADTPNYLARDLDFGAAMATAQGRGQLATSAEGHLASGRRADGVALYREPTQRSIDGNTVEPEREKALFSQNAVAYTASLRLLGNRVQSLLNAIRGE